MSTLGLGVIGNCAIARLIDRNVWHGLGRPDGDMEAAVAGGKEGRQRYLPNTAIPETVVEGRTGALRIVDVAPRFRRFGRMFRPPMPVRRPEPVIGRPRVARRLRPTFNYGGLKPRVTSGIHHARFVGDAAALRLTTDASITCILHETEFGLLRSDDPRFHATLDVIGKRLMKSGFLMRYVEADDFGKPSDAFLPCTLWYIDALASVGRGDEALELFNNVLGRCNHVGLLSEDIDPKTGELWGSFPQTYSQVGLILSAMRLSRTWEEGLWHAS